jgi:subtilisin family serine protease/subtilisin-like proprotein convertase family protein
MNRWRPLTWLLLSVACFLGALYFWRLGNETQANKQTTTHAAARHADTTLGQFVRSASTRPLAQLSRPESTNAASAGRAQNASSKYRLSNTSKTVGQLARSDWGIVLENALIDTGRPLDFAIPKNLRAKGDPGSYIVQARGPIQDGFRAALKAAGAEIISYIPNNAYLVRASASVAQQLAAGPAQAVIPFEPYYKLSPSLLALAVEQRPLPADALLNLVVYPDALAGTKDALQKLGAVVVREGRSPFGPVLTVQTGRDSLPAIAGLSGVGTVQRVFPRASANDLSRAFVGVAADSITQSNYLGLSGSNVIVQVNDTGVDATHPDLLGRVFSDFPFALTDTDGHGTHVAGIIAGSGFESTTVTNAIGSIMPGTNSQFRGMAPSATLFVQPILFSSPSNFLTDFELQEAAAKTNALISDNSWNFSDSDYDIEAASYDAAVRDALPEVTGSQPVLFVFAAGNAGNGNNDGSGVTDGSVLSPATAKNVITVGALEQPRNITNDVVIQGQTNKFWAAMTDSSSQVAWFSSRGNVGVNVEGDFGRFKPDVIAPGVFVVSTRSAQWDKGSYYNPTNVHINSFIDEVAGNGLHGYPIALPYNVVGGVTVDAFPIFQGLDLPIYFRFSVGFPSTNKFDLLSTNQLIVPALGPTNWFYGIGNPTNVTLHYGVVTEFLTTNDNGNELQVLSNMNESIGPWYRYESGTSMAAADVSGVLALMQDFFTNKVQPGFLPSPALMKALLINGARSANALYDFQVNKSLNDQGWGAVNLGNSIPSTLFQTNATSVSLSTLTIGPSPMLALEQSPATALATGDSRTIRILVDPSAQSLPLRVTLVWTDPPGNPAAGLKLVNDLDLVVTNEGSGEIFWGNDIPADSTVNFPWDTNSLPNRDFVNNVENVYLDSGSASNYSITIVGRAVNVNAVTAHPNNVAQDYALIISSGNGESANALTVISGGAGAFLSATTPNVTIMTNEFTAITNISGELLLGQRAGASSPLIGTTTIPLGTKTIWGPNGQITVGMTNQWHFYVLTNSCTSTFTNAAFVTFLPQDLSPWRMGVTNELNPDNAVRPEADIDLYVSTNAALLNLDPVALQQADKSVDRGGTEVITYSNAVPCRVYYVGVKSEDQQAAEFGFFGVFSELPFSQTDANGVQTVRGINVPGVIPDGSPGLPRAAIIMGIAVQPINVRHVIVTNNITHQRFGDLFGVLNHNLHSVVLNNHTLGSTNLLNNYTYEDGEIPGLRRSDGPGNMTDFMGTKGTGLWMLTEVDNANTHTGRVDSIYIRLDPQSLNGNGVELTIAPNSFVFDFVDVPPEATNFTINVRNDSIPALPLQLFVRRGDLPTQTVWDFKQDLGPGGGSLSINATTIPTLQPGRYFIGIFNPSLITGQTVFLSWVLDLSFAPIQPITFTSGGPTPILDDAVSYSSITVTGNLNNVQIAQVAVAVAIDHPRVSDLVLTLVSPAGKRLLLMENRGGPTTANLGTITTVTNFFGIQTAGDLNANTNVITPIPASGVLLIDYNFFQEPDTIDVFYGANDIFSPGPTSLAGEFFIPFGPGVAPNLTIVMNQGGNTNNPTTLWQYTPTIISQTFSYFTFTDNTNFSQVPIKFAIPPFSGSGATVDSPISDFELPTTIGTYGAGAIVDGWTVENNFVRVVNSAAPRANTGSQYLQLLFGDISRVLPTRAGNTYSLTFAYNGLGSATVTVPGIPPVTVTGNDTWQTETILMGSRATGTPVLITSVDPGLLLDSFTLAETSGGTLFYYPEEPLDPLNGDNPQGTWTLEVRDDRVGAASGTPPPEVVSWQLQFIFATNTSSINPLGDGTAVTNTIAPCQFAYYPVDVPAQADFATNILLFATGPVNVWFNQTNTPAGVTPPDFELLTGSTNGSATLFTNGTPTLIPGERYYIGVQNPCASTSNVTFALRIDFGVGIVTLTNMIPYAGTNSGNALLPNDYYHFVIPDVAARAQFEIDNPSGDVSLVVRKGLPLPDFNNFQFISANPGLNDELIVVFTNSAPISLTPGNWYLTAINVSGGPVAYSIVASWWPTTGEPITLTGGFLSGTNSFCITWTSLPGVHYFIQGVPVLTPGMTWTTVLPDIIGDPGPTTTRCIPLPTAYRFFRVVEGIELAILPPTLTISKDAGGIHLRWAGPISARYQVQWTPSLAAGWTTLPNIITSTTGQFSFTDDGTQTGGLNAPRFYKLLILP